MGGQACHGCKGCAGKDLAVSYLVALLRVASGIGRSVIAQPCGKWLRWQLGADAAVGERWSGWPIPLDRVLKVAICRGVIFEGTALDWH